MVIKCAQMRIPFLVSRSGLTQMGHAIAARVGITMLGRASGKHYLAFTGKERVVRSSPQRPPWHEPRAVLRARRLLARAHAGLEAVKATSGQDFAPQARQAAQGRAEDAGIPRDEPERPGAGAEGRRPAAHADRRDLRFPRRNFPKTNLLPKDPWARSQALSQLAWMNSTPHTTFTRVFFPERFAESEARERK